MDQDWKEKLKNIIYYILIGVISVISMIVIPLLDSKIDGGFSWPKNKMEWFIWVIMKSATALINVMMFHCFMQQAKVNVRNDEKYKQANEILHRMKKKVRKPRSPGNWTGKQYGGKGTTIFVFTILSTIAITSAVITFNLLIFLAFVFTITMGLVFGILQMKSAEFYWTTEFYDFAIMKQNEEEEQKKRTLLALDQARIPNPGKSLVSPAGRIDFLEPRVDPFLDGAVAPGVGIHCVLGSPMDASHPDPDRPGDTFKKDLEKMA